MYCRSAAAVILTYDTTSWQSYVELEDRFLSLTDTANADCIFAIVGNKADLTDTHAQASNPDTGEENMSARSSFSSSSLQRKQVNREDAMALYGRVLHYKGLEEKACLPAERMVFETSAKTGYNVDVLFETVFDLVVPSILKKRNEVESTVDLEAPSKVKRTKPGCCA